MGYEYRAGYPEIGRTQVLEKVEFRMLTIQGEVGIFRAIDGKVQKYTDKQWQEMEWPTDTREIAFFDIKDNDGDGRQEIYAIDEYGLAVAELRSGRWEEYIREVRGFEKFPPITDNGQAWNDMFARFKAEPGIMGEVNLNEVVRITGPDGKPLDWDGWWGQCWNETPECALGKVAPKAVGEGGALYMPAIIKGIYLGYFKDYEMLVLELPRRYDRVMIYRHFGNKLAYRNMITYFSLTQTNDWRDTWGNYIYMSPQDLKQLEWLKAYVMAVANGQAPQYQVVVPLVISQRSNLPGVVEVYKRAAELMADEKLPRDEFAKWDIVNFIFPWEMRNFVP